MSLRRWQDEAGTQVWVAWTQRHCGHVIGLNLHRPWQEPDYRGQGQTGHFLTLLGRERDPRTSMPRLFSVTTHCHSTPSVFVTMQLLKVEKAPCRSPAIQPPQQRPLTHHPEGTFQPKARGRALSHLPPIIQS